VITVVVGDLTEQRDRARRAGLGVAARELADRFDEVRFVFLGEGLRQAIAHAAENLLEELPSPAT
jgi:hypothetical protein